MFRGSVFKTGAHVFIMAFTGEYGTFEGEHVGRDGVNACSLGVRVISFLSWA